MNTQESPLFITTSIPYVNAKPHIGYAIEALQADVLARSARAQGRPTRFLIGTDENSLKNVQAAKKAGRPVKEFVDEHAKSFEALHDLLGLSNDDFIRTTQERHILGAQKLWQSFKKEDLYKKAYRGLYCVGCEEFKLEKDLVDGLCPIHKTAPEIVEEENWFFRLSSYQEKIEELLSTGGLKIEPEFRRNEMLAFVRGGLEDLSISRSVKRAEGWGVPVPGDETQIMYVWVDALSNYITALGYAHDEANYQKFWADTATERIHCIGKDIVRFHSIYWPAFLMSANLPLPTTIAVHEFFTISGQKISKSLGNTIDSEELIERYGRDATRYLLLSSLPYGRDGDVSWEKLDTKYTADLVNGLGNLLQRTLVLSKKFAFKPEFYAHETNPLNVDAQTGSFHFDDALRLIWDIVSDADNQLERDKPWAETDEQKREQTLRGVWSMLATIGLALRPYLPETSEAIAKQLESGDPEALFPRLLLRP